jgi:hypothetical protein
MHTAQQLLPGVNFLILRRDLEGKGLGVPERWAAVETETGNAQDSELHRQHIALLAAWLVAGSLVNSGYFTIRKSNGVEARRLMPSLWNQRQIVFFGFMFVCSLCSIRANAAVFGSVRYQ